MTSNDWMAVVFPRGRAPATSPCRPSPPAYRVGEPFQPGRAAWPEGAQYGYGPAGHALTLFAPDPIEGWIPGVAHGDARFALSVVGPVLFLAFRFGERAPWADVPYNFHTQHRNSRSIPPRKLARGTRALLWISLVGSDDGIIHAQRGMTLSPPFSRSLLKAIRNQATSPFDPLDCMLTYSETIRAHPTVEDRLKLAEIWSDGNA